RPPRPQALLRPPSFVFLLSTFVSCSREFLFQDSARFRHPPLERADGDFQHGRDLFVTVFTRSREQQRIAQLRRQRRDQLSDLPLQVGGDQRVLLRTISGR